MGGPGVEGTGGGVTSAHARDVSRCRQSRAGAPAPHWHEKVFVHSIEQVFTESTAAGISGRPDLDSRHDSADGVDDLRRDALRLFGARLGFFEAGVKLSRSFLWHLLAFAAARRKCRASWFASSLFRGCHIGMLAENSQALKDYLPNGKGQSDFSDRPLLMPATTGVYPELAEGLPHTGRVQYHRPCGGSLPCRGGNGWVSRTTWRC